MDKDINLKKRLTHLRLNNSTFAVLFAILRRGKHGETSEVNTMYKRDLSKSELISNGKPSVHIIESDDSKIIIRVTTTDKNESAEEVVLHATTIIEKPKRHFLPITLDVAHRKIKTMPRAGEFMITIMRKNWTPPPKSKHLFS